MFRFLYVIIFNLFRAPYMVTKMRKQANHPQKYSEEQRYRLVQRCIALMNHTGMIRTIATGTENLPKEGGYVMIPNHQGKYDALGIMITHKNPCSLVIDATKSHTMITSEVVDLVQGKRLLKDDVRHGLKIINEMAEEMKKGKRFILFPEGGYDYRNRNVLGDFKAGSFKAAVKAQVPIVPVTLIDSYKVFNALNWGSVTTQVHYLPAIPYEEYKGMKTVEIAAMVKERIQQKLDEVLSRSGREAFGG
ncbi:MAG: 1-acyl-sn-glycerol-3-phosphate acyltransferase [Lachnospiraceae bacterium]|nr:1-acyl-sn-glycerol-3-phosphate acyltransferase [Lachnospiraceae bacterium]